VSFNMKTNDYLKWQILLFITAFLLFNGCVTPKSTAPDDSQASSDEQKSAQNTITAVDIQQNQVLIQSNNKLTYTSVKHIVPTPGIVFYFPDTVLDNVKDISEINNGMIKAIIARQQDLNGPYSKLEFQLVEDTTYETRQNDNQLVVQFKSTEQQAEFSEIETIEPSFDIDTPLQEPVEPPESPEPTESIEPLEPVSNFSVETTPFSRNALVQINSKKPIENYKSSVIAAPPKIVFDLYDIQSPDRNMTFSVSENPFVKGVRTFRYPKRLRMVIDTVPEYISAFQAYPSEEGLSIYVGLDLPAKEAKDMMDISVSSITAPPPEMASMPLQDTLVTSEFLDDSNVSFSSDSPVANDNEMPPIVDAPYDSAPDALEDQSNIVPEPDFQSAFQPPNLTPRPLPVQSGMGIHSQPPISMPHMQNHMSGLQPSITNKLTRQYQKFSFIQPSTMLDSYVQNGSPQKYTGEKIAIDFYETDIKNVFRILREVSGQNFAIDSDVSGKVTLTLKKPVPWDQILDLILKMNKLGITYENDIIRISKMTTIQKAQEERIAKIEAEFKAAKKREELLEPVITHYIPVNYARATDLTKHLDKISTKERGSISVDDRTNTIIITDVKEKIQRALSVVQNLDKPNLQVMIETRIIEVTNNFSRDIGVNWSGTIGVQPGDAEAGVGPQRGYDVLGGTYGYNWAVNYPAAANSNIGINFRRMNGLTPFTLDAQLSAMESKGEIRILTSPRIVALDNKEATIEQGLEYPINTLDEKGNTITEFKDVDLDLKVTPHITQDGRVSMLIDTSKNDLGPVVNGKQSFQKKQAKTELLVNDGDTVVIGGIMKTVRSTSRSGVPLLSRLPIIGWLFKTHSKSDDKEELIIFITPKIIKLENKALVRKMAEQ